MNTIYDIILTFKLSINNPKEFIKLKLVAKEIESYCSTHSSPMPEIFKTLASETYESTSAPQMMVGHLEGAFLRLLTRLVQPQTILEIGTFTGYSSLAMAEGLPEHGKIITCDVNLESTQIARKYWEQSPHGSKIESRLGPALETIASLDVTFDMVFIDADKGNYINYWEACLPKVRQGGLIIADNALWSGRVLEPDDASDHALANFNTHAVNDARVECVLLTIRDGMMLAWKK